jgi:hypothetical protein
MRGTEERESSRAPLPAALQHLQMWLLCTGRVWEEAKLLDCHEQVPSSCSTLLQGREVETHWAEDEMEQQEVGERVGIVEARLALDAE